MSTLNVRFAGVLTHFRDVVPGVAHRAVLPNATSLRIGYLHLPWFPITLPYYILPHFAMLLTPHGIPRPNVPGIIVDGAILAGAHFEVMNPAGAGVTHPTFENTAALLDFVPQYDYSTDVVLGGRAACYFDVLSGAVNTAVAKGGAQQVVITIETDGAPQIRVRPFRPRATHATAALITLEKAEGAESYELTVGNLDIAPHLDDVPFDFLLNYLTAINGIPDVITSKIPGLDLDELSDLERELRPQSEEGLRKALMRLVPSLYRGIPSSEEMDRIIADELTPACSDSRYP